MKKEIAELWIKALESGKYKQIRRQLANKDGYCCLGVLCELAIENGVEVSRKFDKDKKDKDVIRFDSNGAFLPESVMKWAGMNSIKGHFNPLIGFETNLSDLNDGGYSFEKIAGTIKQYWKEL